MEIISFCKARIAGNGPVRTLVGKEGANRVAINVAKDIKKRLLVEYQHNQSTAVRTPRSWARPAFLELTISN